MLQQFLVLFWFYWPFVTVLDRDKIMEQNMTVAASALVCDLNTLRKSSSSLQAPEGYLRRWQSANRYTHN